MSRDLTAPAAAGLEGIEGLDADGSTFRTPADRLDGLVLGWARWYTRDLPREAAVDRVAELGSDLHEERASSGTAASRSILLRWLRGMPSDLAWRAARLRGVAIAAPRGTFPRMVPASANAAAALLVGWGVLVVGRTAPLIVGGSWFGAWDLVAATAVGLALAVAGAVLSLAPGRRWLGSLVLAVAAYLLLQHGSVAIATASTTVGSFVGSQPVQAGAVVDALTVAGVLGFAGLALWWAPLDRRHRAEVAR
ncbi:hypothetical protein GCM10009819_17090 [Agromyces tropicus]|uniref:Uncharacterized protein n=1 Tax=Agromyces tropicus TaxID=555371 RepID=A0ABN2UAW2_9MICO